jgi:hypothetical protein
MWPKPDKNHPQTLEDVETSSYTGPGTKSVLNTQTRKLQNPLGVE